MFNYRYITMFTVFFYIPLIAMEESVGNKAIVAPSVRVKLSAKELIEKFEQAAEMEALKPTEQITHPITYEELDWFFSSPESFDNFQKAKKDFANPEKKGDAINILSRLAKKDDHIPSKFFLYKYYADKKIKNNKQTKKKRALLEKKDRAKDWLESAILKGYPPAQFEHGLNLLKIGHGNGLVLVQSAAYGVVLGTSIESMPNHIKLHQTVYHHLPAALCLAEFYYSLPDTNLQATGNVWAKFAYDLDCFLQKRKESIMNYRVTECTDYDNEEL